MGVVSSCETSARSCRRARSGPRRLRPAGQVVRHGVERRRDGGHFIAAAIRRAGGEIAAPEAPGRVLERTQPAPRRSKDHDRRQQRSRHQNAGSHERQRRCVPPEEEYERRPRRHHDDTGHVSVDDDWCGPYGPEARASPSELLPTVGPSQVGIVGPEV
jgi:hypothetical protein